MIQQIRKRDGSLVEFDLSKIAKAVEKAILEVRETIESEHAAHFTSRKALSVAEKVMESLCFSEEGIVEIEEVQDIVEITLMDMRLFKVAKAYILYREGRHNFRHRHERLMEKAGEIANADSSESDEKRSNGNVDGNSAMGSMLMYGTTFAKEYFLEHMVEDESAKAHAEGDIHIHDLDFFNLTSTCCQMDIEKMLKDGFSTGHGYLREPNHIASYGALAAIALQSNQNDQHGGQSIGNFDSGMAIGVRKTFKTNFIKHYGYVIETLAGREVDAKKVVEGYEKEVREEIAIEMPPHLIDLFLTKIREQDYKVVYDRALRETKKQTHQAMEALIGNLNTMNSRAGAQTPFTSINYGSDTSPEGRMVIRAVLQATLEGLGNGETPIFPIQVFRLHKGVNYDAGDPNYDLFQLALKCSAKRLYPNFVFQDATFNMKFYKPEDSRTLVTAMGCRTRVMSNIHDPSRQFSFGRGNLNFTTINLPRLAIKADNYEHFLEMLTEKLELAAAQTYARYRILAKKKAKNFPFLMGQGVWLDSDTLEPEDEIGEVLKHGTLTLGFIGLAESLALLTGKHHGECEKSQVMGLEIVGHMRKFCDEKTQELKMNYSLISTPAEGLAGRFTTLDSVRFGVIEGVTDKEYYTNGFHVPVDFKIDALSKIKIEAPYHELTNAGHISYVEVDGNLSNNLPAFEKLVKTAGEHNMGYFAVNHPVDFDPSCGYTGVIGDECPKCYRWETEQKPFERIRRITGYLTGTLNRWNNAKQREEADRVKHTVKGGL